MVPRLQALSGSFDDCETSYGGLMLQEPHSIQITIVNTVHMTRS